MLRRQPDTLQKVHLSPQDRGAISMGCQLKALLLKRSIRSIEQGRLLPVYN